MIRRWISAELVPEPGSVLYPCTQVGQMRCTRNRASLSKQAMIGIWYDMDGSRGRRRPPGTTGGCGERRDAFFYRDQSVGRTKDRQVRTRQLAAVGDGVMVMLSLEKCPCRLVQRFDIGTENVVLGGGRKEVLDVGVLTVLRGGLGKVVIKPQRRCLVKDCILGAYGDLFTCSSSTGHKGRLTEVRRALQAWPLGCPDSAEQCCESHYRFYRRQAGVWTTGRQANSRPGSARGTRPAPGHPR
jgi:hypothetical protein